MPSRQLEKVSKVIQSTVSDVIRNELSDPRVQGMVSVTRVDPAPDLRSAKVYLSILGVDSNQEALSFSGIQSASGYIRSCLSRRLTMKTCPLLDFYLDEGLKKSFATMQLINQISQEQAQREASLADLAEIDGQDEPAEMKDAE